MKKRFGHAWIDLAAVIVIVAAIFTVGDFDAVEMFGKVWVRIAMSQLLAKLLFIFASEFQGDSDAAFNRKCYLRIGFAIAGAFAG